MSFREPMHYSKSKARRQRAVCVRNRLWRQAASAIPATESNQGDSSIPLDAKLAFLQSLIMDVHWALVGKWYASEYCADMYGSQEENDHQTGVVLSSLRPDAEEFVPKGISTTPCGTTKCNPNPCPDYSSRCAKCREKVEECICFDAYCGFCWKVADHCDCLEPLVHQRSCAACDTREDVLSLFDTILEQSPYPKSFNCKSCQCSQSQPIELFCLGGAHTCQTCFRVTCQDSIIACDGIDCDQLNHEACMEQVACPAACKHDRPLFLCGRCFASKNTAQCPDCLLENQDTVSKQINKQDDDSLLHQNAATAFHTEKASVLDEIELGKQRKAALNKFEGVLGQLMDSVDEVDAGTVSCPRPVRDLALLAAKDTYAWFSSAPSTRSIEELSEKTRYLEDFLSKIAKRCTK